MKVMALYGFDHYGLKRSGQVFDATPATANELIARGLVEELTPPKPKVARKRIAKPVAFETEQDAADQ